MDTIRIVPPAEEHERAVMEYRDEFLQHGETPYGSAGLKKANRYADWLAAARDNRREETVRDGRVPALTGLALRESDGRLVGMVQILLRLNEELLRTAGHIGYSARRSERRKGYAKEMLRLALAQCREMGISRVLVTCDSENTASEKTILSCGGVLENEVSKDGRMTRRYWIEINTGE